MPLAATLSPAVKVTSVRAPSATTTTAGRPEAIPPAEEPASEEDFTAAVALGAAALVAVGAGNRT